MKRNIVESFSIEEAFKALNKRSNSKTKISEALESVKIQLNDPELVSADDLAMYAANPTVQKYASREVFTKIAKEGAVLEMTSDDFGDGHGEPKGYIFAKDGKVGYIVLSSNAYDYVPSISYRDFKAIVEGKDLLWNEIGFGDFSAAANYVSEPVTSVDDIIAECEVQSSVYLWNMENLEESVACKSTDKVSKLVESGPVIPAPYDKYFVISDYVPDPDSSGEYQVGEQIEGYDAHLIAYLDTKPEYSDSYEGWPMLVDDERYPVIEIVGGRMFPVDVEELFGDAVTEAARTFSSSDAYVMVTQGFKNGDYTCDLARFPDRIDLLDTVLYICNVTDSETYQRLKKLPPNAFNKQLAAIVNKASDDGLFDDYGIAYIKDKGTGKIIAGVDLQDEIIDMINTYADSEARAANAIRSLKSNYPFTF